MKMPEIYLLGLNDKLKNVKGGVNAVSKTVNVNIPIKDSLLKRNLCFIIFQKILDKQFDCYE